MQSDLGKVHENGSDSARLDREPGRVQERLQMRSPSAGHTITTAEEILLSKEDEQWDHLPTAQVAL